MTVDSPGPLLPLYFTHFIICILRDLRLVSLSPSHRPGPKIALFAAPRLFRDRQCTLVHLLLSQSGPLLLSQMLDILTHRSAPSIQAVHLSPLYFIHLIIYIFSDLSLVSLSLSHCPSPGIASVAAPRLSHNHRCARVHSPSIQGERSRFLELPDILTRRTVTIDSPGPLFAALLFPSHRLHPQ